MDEQIAKCIRLYKILTGRKYPRICMEPAVIVPDGTTPGWSCGILAADTSTSPNTQSFTGYAASPSAALTNLESILMVEARARFDAIQPDLT
jgi:hypothetical protein